MKSLCFTLSGPAACFRQPDVNTQVYFTYNNIHKVALLGLLGAVLGLSGYRNAKLHGQEERVFPEFYEVLSSLLVSVVPNGKNGYFTKKIQYFNNSVGYASKEKGGNLQVREQWLENPSWTIFLAQHNLDDVVWDKLCSNLLQGQCVYIPYLGRNDFPAQIEDVLMVELSPSRQSRIDSLFLYEGDLKALDGGGPSRYLFVETAPIGLVPNYNFYEFRRYVFTNGTIPEAALPSFLYTDGDRQYCFY
ncbi:type I-B CRISPR-associated protein Cas5b [Desulfoscipio gibsoniae]|uniref:CRISPR-associated protein Cas5, subtype I-B/HMARI n=1 Tax=Desulfoscipio gibsoniae DSM 7213 TaxID=767817 RepID=R4KHX6_9FIRM|nr:type I-B CRISPR-associated protein Cas5b [Desulfoscipio gibsoniae]AGL00110.1 CRISPR-associated protein Cas5, subtype I-B/HMARI [Desulfoscipio gibsoniae DSM 7213]